MFKFGLVSEIHLPEPSQRMMPPKSPTAYTLLLSLPQTDLKFGRGAGNADKSKDVHTFDAEEHRAIAPA
jgi:hypothetical protein